MTALESLKTRLKQYDMSQYDYDFLLDKPENRGVFLRSRINHFIGDYIEECIPEWDPDPQAKHLGVGKKTDRVVTWRADGDRASGPGSDAYGAA